MKSDLERRAELLDSHIQARPPALLDAIEKQQANVVLTRGDQVEPAPIEWLWQDWVAKGKLHVLAGAPGQGKTTIALGIASVVSRGGQFPDGAQCEPGNVLVWSGEDDVKDGLAPKLLAAGADMSRIHFVDSVEIDGERIPFDPARDMEALQASMASLGDVSLLILDPMVTVVTGDSHKNTEVRKALQPLVDLGANSKAAVLGITHFSKGGQGQDPAQRVVGSVAFTAVARVVLVAASTKTEDGSDRRVLARSKSNIGPDDGGFEYQLAHVEVRAGIKASAVSWGAALQGTARDLLAQPDESEHGSALSGAEEFLREVLGADTVPAKDVFAEAKESGHSLASVRRAADRIGVRKTKSGMSGGWYWTLRSALADGAPHD